MAKVPEKKALPKATKETKMPSKRRSAPPTSVLQDGSQVFECKYCFQKFPAYMSLVAHLRKHKESKEKTESKDDEESVENKQQSTNPTQCLGCGKKFAYKGPFFNHINTCAKNKKRLEKLAQEKEQKRIEHSKLPPSLQPKIIEEQRVPTKELTKNLPPVQNPKKEFLVRPKDNLPKEQDNPPRNIPSKNNPSRDSPPKDNPSKNVLGSPKDNWSKPIEKQESSTRQKPVVSFEKATYKTDNRRPLFLSPPPKSIVYLPVHDNQWAPYQSIQKKIAAYVAQLEASSSV